MTVENESATENETVLTDEVTQEAPATTEGSETTPEVTEGAATEEKPEDSGEFDVVLEGEEEAPTPQKVPRRIRNLLADKTKLQGEVSQAGQESQRLLQENEALRSQLAQRRPAQAPSTMPIAPNESSADIDYDDEKLAAANAKYAKEMEDWVLSRQTSAANAQAQEEQRMVAQEAETAALESYYDKAEKA